MNVARPPGGFNVVVVKAVQDYIKAEAGENFRVPQCFSDLLDRIKITGLREGTPIPPPSPPTFTFIGDGAPDFRIPTIQVVYNCLGDTLTVTNALIWNDLDHEDDESDDAFPG
jgi:hypothetical protein